MTTKLRRYESVFSFDWETNRMEMREVTCRNHPTALYLTKHYHMRTLHLIRSPHGFDRECTCPAYDLVVLIGE